MYPTCTFCGSQSADHYLKGQRGMICAACTRRAGGIHAVAERTTCALCGRVIGKRAGLLRRLGLCFTNGILPQPPGAASCKRVLDGALGTDARARRAQHGGRAPPLGWEVVSGQLPDRKEVRGAARRSHGRGVVGRGALMLARASRRSAPRALTKPKN